jgi:hypothetical protein
MSTFKLNRFSHPESLKAIAPERLLTFLRPYQTYFSSRGFELPESGQELDYDVLVAILINPDEDVPTEMVEALYVVHETADETVMEQLLEEARTAELELEFGDEPTAADVAIVFWLHARSVLRRVHAESYVARSRRFEYSLGATRQKRDFPQHPPEKLREIAASLDAWFIEHKRGGGSDVFIIPRGEKVFLLIRHGSSMRREASINKGKHGAAYYRPEVHDVLVYDTASDLLGLKAETKGEKSLYRSTFGRILFGSDTYFRTQFRMTLDLLKERGPALLACQDVDGMQSVKLVEVRRWFGGEYKDRQIQQATDVFGALGDKWKERLGSGKLIGATFEVTIGEGKSARTRKVSISPPDVAKYDRDDDAEIIETWLRRRGIMPGSPQEETHAESTVSLLAGAAGSAELEDREGGLAVAAR